MKIFNTLLLIGLFTLALSAQPDGTLDLSFDGTGFTSFAPGPLHDNINRVETQSDGKIIFAGQSNVDNLSFSSLDVRVGRTNLDGTLDLTFGDNGYYTFNNAAGSDFAYDMAILPDGKILIGGGYTITPNNTAFLVIRLNPDGTPDNTFGNNGSVVIDIDSGEDYCRTIFPQADGSIICAGWSSVPGFTYNRIAFCKLAADGTEDVAYGQPLLSQATNSQYNVLEGVQVGNSLFLVGSVYDDALFSDLPIVVKTNLAGALDNTFDTDGFYVSPIEGYFTSLADSGSGLHIVGDDETTNDYDGLITALDYNGVVQTNFGVNGYSTFDLYVLDGWSNISYQNDGKILVCGVTGTGIFDRYLLVARFNTDGSLDTSFGTDGSFLYDEGALFDVANDITTAPDGKIIIGGVTASTNNDMLLIRLHNNTGVVQPLVATVAVSSPTCAGTSDGMAQIAVTGGTWPYTYFLDGGTTDVGNTIINLSDGNHTVLITDANGETISINFTVAEPLIIEVTVTVTGDDILATATGGTPPYQFSLDGGASQPTGDFPDLGFGNFTISVLDANDCTVITEVSILSSAKETFDTKFSITPTLVSNGQIVIKATDAEGALKIFNVLGDCVLSQHWDKGQSTTTLALDVPAGNYFVVLGGEMVKIVVLR